MSIEYITEAEYEARFAKWSRRRGAAAAAVQNGLAYRIALSNNTLAGCYMRSAGEATRWLRDLKRAAVQEVLRQEFQKRFASALTGPDRNCIGFLAEWEEQP